MVKIRARVTRVLYKRLMEAAQRVSLEKAADWLRAAKIFLDGREVVVEKANSTAQSGTHKTPLSDRVREVIERFGESA